MDTFTPVDDALGKEIAAIEAAIANENADVKELEELLSQKRQNIQMLAIELKALRRAASLRPVAGTGSYAAPPSASAASSSATNSISSAAPAPAPAAAAMESAEPEPAQPSRFRPVSRPNDVRPLSRASDSTFM